MGTTPKLQFCPKSPGFRRNPAAGISRSWLTILLIGSLLTQPALGEEESFTLAILPDV